MKEKKEFHVRANKEHSEKAKELSKLTHSEIYELGCKIIIEQHQNKLDNEIIELNEILSREKKLKESILERLKLGETPTQPSSDINTDDTELTRNIIPIDLFKEILTFYMNNYNISGIEELNEIDKNIFKFVLINISNHQLNLQKLNEEYKNKKQ